MAKSRERKGCLRWVKRGLALMVVGGISGLAFIVYANSVTNKAGEGKLFTDETAVPGGRVALVFGCSPMVGSRENLYFNYRMDAAVKLWEAGKVRGFIVSGDNRQASYNEPKYMKEALVARGVPAGKIVCDYAGLRTFDSVVRAKEVFGNNDLVFVSQKFQNERAQYMAQELGMDAVSIVASDVSGRGGLTTKLRESLARPKMLLDFHVFNTKAKHLGAEEKLPF